MTSICLAALVPCSAAFADASGAIDWQARTSTDLEAAAQGARENYISAVYPDPSAWRRKFDQDYAAVRSKIPLVHDEASYQAVLRYFLATFHDSHVWSQFATPVETSWPGFAARYDNGVYRITASELTDVKDGAMVTSCDGKPVSWWAETIGRYESGLPIALETTRMTVALRLFVDRGSPLRPRPSRCVIDGRTIPLRWQPIGADKLSPINRSWQGAREVNEVGTRFIGTDGAWVRLGYFDPGNAAQAQGFHAAIDAAASLRDKRFIILDVRGNGGGPYNWFMAYLRGLYGQAYADHYATARLRIRAVYRLSPAVLKQDEEYEAADIDYKTPADPPYERNKAIDKEEQARAIAANESFYRSAPLVIPSGAPPPNPVRAKVYVLTDYGCASACIGFVDELKLFPGVSQIGLPTYVDSRSGTGVPTRLPSGAGTVNFASMTRDGRVRGDNVPQIPLIRFDGDIRDDVAVKAWVLDEILPYL